MSKRKKHDLTTALFRVTRDKVGLAVHRDANGRIIEQREIPYLTQAQLDGEDLLASIVSAAITGTIMFLGFKIGKEIAEKICDPEYVFEQWKENRHRRPSQAEITRAEENRKARHACIHIPEPIVMHGFAPSVTREWFYRSLPAEISPSEMQQIEITKIPRRYL